MAAEDFGELHFGPELDEVEDEESNDYDAEHEHVLRSPFNLRGLSDNVVGVVATSFAVLECQPDGVDNVDDEEGCKADGCNECIPVGAEECAHGIVGGGPEDGDTVHQHMEGNE